MNENMRPSDLGVIVCVVIALGILAGVCGKRSPRWWLSAGGLALWGALVVANVVRRPHSAHWSWWLYESIWYGVGVLGAITWPLAFGWVRIAKGESPVIGVLVLGALGAYVGMFLAISVTCPLAHLCAVTIPE
jgi:hypothetical protein